MSKNSNTEDRKMRKDGPDATIVIKVSEKRAEEILASFGWPMPQTGDLTEIILRIDREKSS